MSRGPIPSLSAFPEPADPDTLRRRLRDVDALSQEATAQIVAVMRSARQMVRGETPSLVDLDHLLAVAEALALGLENAINYEAEQAGANYVDEAQRAFVARTRRAAAGRQS